MSEIDYRGIAIQACLQKACHQDIEELIELLEVLVQQDPKIYLEIGTYYGGGTWAVQQVIPDTKIFCVDNCSLTTTINTKACLESHGVKATYLDRDSQQSSTADELKKLIPEGVDFLFIDGNHGYNEVKRDWELYSPLVNKGGVVALHDVFHDASVDVGRFWNELKVGRTYTEISRAVNPLGVGLIWL